MRHSAASMSWKLDDVSASLMHCRHLISNSSCTKLIWGACSLIVRKRSQFYIIVGRILQKTGKPSTEAFVNARAGHCSLRLHAVVNVIHLPLKCSFILKNPPVFLTPLPPCFEANYYQPRPDDNVWFTSWIHLFRQFNASRGNTYISHKSPVVSCVLIAMLNNQKPQ